MKRATFIKQTSMKKLAFLQKQILQKEAALIWTASFKLISNKTNLVFYKKDTIQQSYLKRVYLFRFLNSRYFD